MLNEFNEILTTVLTTLTASGGFGIWLHKKHNRRMRQLEAQLAEANVKKAKVESKVEEWHIIKEENEILSKLNQQLIERNGQLVKMNAEKEDRYQEDKKEMEERYQGDKKEMEERFNNQTLFLRNVQRDFVASLEREKQHIRREGLLERRIAYLMTWICKKGNCDHGEPPRDRLHGRAFDDRQAEETDIENNETLKLIEEK